MAPDDHVADFVASHLFFVPGDGELADLLAEGARVLARQPQLLTRIVADRDAATVAGKARRQAEAQWHLEQTPVLAWISHRCGREKAAYLWYLVVSQRDTCQQGGGQEDGKV